MTEEERTIWLCIWRQVADRDAPISLSRLKADLRTTGVEDVDAEAALLRLRVEGHIYPGAEVGTIELEDTGWRLMASALAGSRTEVQAKIVPFSSRGRPQR